MNKQTLEQLRAIVREELQLFFGEREGLLLPFSDQIESKQE